MPGMDAPASERINAPNWHSAVVQLRCFTLQDLHDLERNCKASHRKELRRVRRKCYAAIGGVLMVGWLLGLVFSAAVVCLFPM